jgi:hypothetical protein
MTYDLLLDEAIDYGLIVKEKSLQGSDGRICDCKIAIRKDIDTSSRKMCVLAEELGHYMTSVGDILDQSDLNNAKQEHKARVWAYNRLLSVDKVIEAAANGYTTTWDMAEYLDVDEEFLKDYLTWQGILDILL